MGWDGVEKRNGPRVVTQPDFDGFKDCVERYRLDAKDERRQMMQTITLRLDKQDETLNKQNEVLQKIDGALFNEKDGLVYMRNWLCRMAKLGLWLGSGALTVAAALATILGSLGLKLF